jgi:hypothetical protein
MITISKVTYGILFSIVFFGAGLRGAAQPGFSKALYLGGVEGVVAMRKLDSTYLLGVLTVPPPDYVYVLKIAETNQLGEVLWQNSFSNGIYMAFGSEHGNQGMPFRTKDGFFIAGNIINSQGDVDVFLLKTGEWGDSLWMHTYGGPYDDLAVGLCALNDSTVLIYGDYSQSSGGDDEYLWIMALDLDGNLRWEGFYKEDGYPSVAFKDLAVLENGDIVMLYNDCDNPLHCGASTQKRLRLAYLDPEGNQLWSSTLREYTLEGHSAELLLPLDNGQFLVASHRLVGLVSRPPTLYWVDQTGQIVQQYDFPDENQLYLMDLFLSSSGDIIGCGTSDGYINGAFYGAIAWVFSMTQDGQMNWERLIYDENYPFEGSALSCGIETEDKGLLFGGFLVDTVALYSTAWLLKLDSLGCYEPGCGDIQFVDVQELLPAPRPARPAAYALYPNPARAGGQLRLVYQAASGAPMAARALLFDAYGRQMAAHRLPPGPQPELPLGDWPPGLYLLRLETAQGEVLQVERVVLGR